MLVASITQRDSHGLSRGIPSGESRSRESRTYGGRVLVFVRVAEVGSTHRASSAPGVRKGSWSERALARRKPEALLTQSTGGEKANRCAVERSFPNSSRSIGLRVKARMFATRRKALSGCCAADPHGKVVPESFDLQVNVRDTIREERVTASASGGFGDRFGRACR
jgi:hypothetical protein